MLVELEVWLTKEDTHPELIPILIASIRSWLMDPYGDVIITLLLELHSN